jgi:hypothetical protein
VDEWVADRLMWCEGRRERAECRLARGTDLTLGADEAATFADLVGELWSSGVCSTAAWVAGSAGLDAPRAVEKPRTRSELRVVHSVRIPDPHAPVTAALRRAICV